MAVDGDLQQPASLYHHPNPACGCMVCPLRLVGSAQFDFGAVSFFEYRYAAAEISWLSAKTLVVIAHKLPAIMNADQICVIDHGKLVAAGKHQDLIRSCPEYQKLWKAAQDSAEWKVHTAKEGA